MSLNREQLVNRPPGFIPQTQTDSNRPLAAQVPDTALAYEQIEFSMRNGFHFIYRTLFPKSLLCFALVLSPPLTVQSGLEGVHSIEEINLFEVVALLL